MHVAYILCQDGGGLPHYTAELANAMAERMDVSVFKPTESSADEYFADGVDVHEVFEPMRISVPKIARNELSPLDIARSLRSFGNLRMVDDVDPDVVHLTASTELFPYLKYFVWRTGISERYPFVETFHNLDPDKWLLRLDDLGDVDEDQSLKWLAVNNVKNLLGRLLPDPTRTHSLVHSEDHRQRLIDRGVDERTVSRIHHGIYELFNTGQTLDTEEDTILFFGNLVGRKGPDTLVQALPNVLERVPNATVVFAGSGTFSEASKRTIEQYRDRFELHNRFIPNDEVGEFYARADIVAFPHRRLTGTSGTLTIAYSFGKPVVTTNLGSFPELVADAGTGITVPPGDPTALADALVTILNNPNIKDAMRENTESLRRTLSWDNVAEEHVTVYERCVNRQT